MILVHAAAERNIKNAVGLNPQRAQHSRKL